MEFEMYDRSHRFGEVVEAVGGAPLRLAITVDEDIAETPTAQLIALALCNIVPRISERYTTIDLALPVRKVAIPRMRWSGTLGAFLLAELNALCPWGRFRLVERLTGKYDHCLVVGNQKHVPAAHVVYALASGWRCFVSEAGPLLRPPLTFNSSSCLATASLTAMFLYHRAEHIETIVQESEINGWSLWDYTRSTQDGPDLPPILEVGNVWQAGMGGTGNALLWALRYGPDLAGKWSAAEHENADLTNWNRYLLMNFEDAASRKHKAEIAIREFAAIHPGLEFTVIPNRVEPLYSYFDEADIVLATVDDPKVRVDLQPHSKSVLLNVGTNSQMLSVSVHKTAEILTGTACVGCLLGTSDQAERRLRESTVSFVLGLAGAVLGSEFVKACAFRRDSLCNSWLANIFYPAAARAVERPTAANCPICKKIVAIGGSGVPSEGVRDKKTQDSKLDSRS